MEMTLTWKRFCMSMNISGLGNAYSGVNTNSKQYKALKEKGWLEVRKMAFEDLDACTCEILKNTIDYLTGCGQEIDQRTVKTRINDHRTNKW